MCVKKSGFTLIELMIVVSILGILAAIVLPEVQGYTQKAKEAAAKDNLRVLRVAIERYAAEHNGVPPGYPGNDPTGSPGVKALSDQLFSGTYLSERPKNPFNNVGTIKLIGNNETFPTEAVTIDLYGWIYQPATKTIKLNKDGSDSEGTVYFNY